MMCIEIDVLFSIIRVVRMWCGILVSAAGFINNGGTQYVNLCGSVHTATISITSLQNMTNHKRPNVTRSIRH